MHAGVRHAIIWRVSLGRIEQVVSGHLGPGRVRGNAAGSCFSRQVSMYLAKHVGHWSLSPIGKFYNGRHHTTVLHAIAKIENLRKTDESVDALIEVLIDELAAGPHETESRLPVQTRAALVEAVATRVMKRLTELRIIEAPPDNAPERIPVQG
ncbi:MAG TPA: helix-turn-helix domain-containing protein [Bryobacteraceae bacterium]|nr:helix-turn-helix domain-containing protein [Bryobacteraceae bacterium]